MIPLSVIIITHNEAANIEECLKAVIFADEIIVLDSGSSDETVEIATRMGAIVSIAKDWPGFGIQKNRALAIAKHPWVLSIDADERVTVELKAEILSAISGVSGVTAYSIPRLSSYCGQFMRHSGWQPDLVTRLFLREKAIFSNDIVHERLVVKAGSVGRLKSKLLHLSFPNFESVLDKVDRYSTAGASMMHTKGKTASLWSALGHGAWSFFRTYILRLGFLDGQLGLALAISNAEGTYYRYLKLWILGRNKTAQKNGGRL